MRPEKRMGDTPQRTRIKFMVVRSIISLLALITVNYAVMLEHPTNLNDVSGNDTKAGIELIEHSNSDQHVRVRRNAPTPASILGVEVQNHIPMNESDMICLYYPLMATGRKPFYVQQVNFVTMTESMISIEAQYESLEDEEVLIMIQTLMFSKPSTVTVDYCNKFWKTLTPKLLVQRDLDAYDNIQPVVIKATQMKAPVTCLSSTEGIKTMHRVGFTQGCPDKRIFMGTLFPWPATDLMIWLCDNNIYTYLPLYWRGRCAPYWIPPSTVFGKVTIPTAWPEISPNDLSGTFKENDEVKYTDEDMPVNKESSFCI